MTAPRETTQSYHQPPRRGSYPRVVKTHKLPATLFVTERGTSPMSGDDGQARQSILTVDSCSVVKRSKVRTRYHVDGAQKPRQFMQRLLTFQIPMNSTRNVTDGRPSNAVPPSHNHPANPSPGKGALTPRPSLVRAGRFWNQRHIQEAACPQYLLGLKLRCLQKA